VAGKGSSQTDLDDGNLTQVIDVVPIVRRSLAFGTGLWIANVIFIHTTIAARNMLIDLYNPRLADDTPANKNGYPVIVPEGFDVWLISASLTTNDATDFATFGMSLVTQGVGAGIAETDTEGVESTPVGAAAEIPLSFWDDTMVLTNGTIVGLTHLEEITPQYGFRIRRGELLSVDSLPDTGGTVTNNLQLKFGLFPVALGQDIAY